MPKFCATIRFFYDGDILGVDKIVKIEYNYVQLRYTNSDHLTTLNLDVKNT